MHKYIHKLDCEIERRIEHATSHDGLNMHNEEVLHILFENRKHAIAWHKNREKLKAELARIHAE